MIRKSSKAQRGKYKDNEVEDETEVEHLQEVISDLESNLEKWKKDYKTLQSKLERSQKNSKLDQLTSLHESEMQKLLDELEISKNENEQLTLVLKNTNSSKLTESLHSRIAVLENEKRILEQKLHEHNDEKLRKISEQKLHEHNDAKLRKISEGSSRQENPSIIQHLQTKIEFLEDQLEKFSRAENVSSPKIHVIMMQS